VDAVTDRRKLTTADLARIAVFGALIAAFALPGQFYLAGSSVPVTLQTLGIMLAGLLLGAVRGALAVLVYLAMGAVGLPVFSGGAAGLAPFAGPTGGYLIAFPLGAFVIGLIAHRARPFDRALGFTACVVGGIGVVYAIGVPWLAWRLGLSMEEALVTGAAVFLPGDLLKAGLATFVAAGVYRAYPKLSAPRRPVVTDPADASP
jgi:biotin transport system substrate-specific component